MPENEGKTPETEQEAVASEQKAAEPAPAPQQETPPHVDDTAAEGNGIPLEAVALKEDVLQMLEPLNAKLDALAKENTDLREQNAGLIARLDKYEKGDFGSLSQVGDPKGTKEKYKGFEEYSKQFM